MGEPVRVDAHAAVAACEDPGWAALTDDDIERMYAAHAAAFPEIDEHVDSSGTVADAVAAAETAPLSPALLGGIAGIDPADLDDAALTSYVVACGRIRNAWDGRLGTAVALLHERAQQRGDATPNRLVAAELGPALGLGTGGADRLVVTSVELASRLPSTLQAVRTGELSWQKATSLADGSACLDDAAAAALEAQVLPQAAERTPARHAAAVRRVADRLDPANLEERRRRADATIALVRTHVGDGMGELLARMPSDELDTVYLAADTYARRCKAAGDPRTLERLRVAAVVQWASAFLGYGDPCATEPPDDPDVAPPTRHGRPARVRVLTSLPALLGESDTPGELADSGATIPASTVREIARRGAALRRMIVDDDTGELLDLTADEHLLPAADGVDRGIVHEIAVVVSEGSWSATAWGDLPEPFRALLAAPLSRDSLDAAPDRYRPSARLAEFVAARDRHPTNPAAGESAASACDLDHIVTHSAGGPTAADNLASPTRRWHVLRTRAGCWVVQRVGRGWRWTSPLGRAFMVQPHDYRGVLDAGGDSADDP